MLLLKNIYSMFEVSNTFNYDDLNRKYKNHGGTDGCKSRNFPKSYLGVLDSDTSVFFSQIHITMSNTPNREPGANNSNTLPDQEQLRLLKLNTILKEQLTALNLIYGLLNRVYMNLNEIHGDNQMNETFKIN